MSARHRLALALKLLLLGEAGLYLAFWLGPGQKIGGSATLLVCAAFAVGWRLLPVLTSFAVAGVWWRPAAGTPRQRLLATLRECWDVLWLYHGPQLVHRDRLPRAGSAGPVVVLVHGFLCNGGLFTRLIALLAERGVGRVHAVSLDPLYGSIEAVLTDFAVRLEEILAVEGVDRVVLVGHSMGGLLVRMHRIRCPEQVAAAIAIAAPHHGTILGHWIGAGERLPPTPATRWLAAFNAARQQDGGDRGLVNLYSEADNIVAPQHSAVLPEATNLPPERLGHLSLMRDRRVLARVADLIRSTGPVQVSLDSGAPRT